MISAVILGLILLLKPRISSLLSFWPCPSRANLVVVDVNIDPTSAGPVNEALSLLLAGPKSNPISFSVNNFPSTSGPLRDLILNLRDLIETSRLFYDLDPSISNFPLVSRGDSSLLLEGVEVSRVSSVNAICCFLSFFDSPISLSVVDLAVHRKTVLPVGDSLRAVLRITAGNRSKPKLFVDFRVSNVGILDNLFIAGKLPIANQGSDLLVLLFECRV